jgi:glycosyltransferase involved in cell wall biosynthesis
MKRVLITVHKFFPEHRAGTEVLALKVAQELMARGHQVRVVTANPPDTDARRPEGDWKQTTSEPAHIDYEWEGVPVHVIQEDLRLANSGFDSEYYHPAIKNHFAKILQDFKPDLLHVFHAQNLSASIIEAAHEQSIPTVLSATDFWFVCPIVQLILPSGKVCRGPNAAATNCLTCYTPKLFPQTKEVEQAFTRKYKSLAESISKLPARLSSTLWQGVRAVYVGSKLPSACSATTKRPAKLRHFANQFISAIMVPTKLMRDIFVENGIDSKLIHHVPFGIDTKPLEAHQNKSPSNVLRIGYIGTLFEHKGVDLLIESFLGMSTDVKANLTIYGDLNQFPEYGAKLTEMVSNSQNVANAKKIHFGGTFPNARFGEVLADIDVLVVPSRWYENTPLVMQSALASKTPLVATNLGGMSEIIEHNKNGLLFELNNADALRGELLRLVNDPALLSRLRDGIERERTVAQMVDDIESIYMQVLDKPQVVSLNAKN